MNKIEVWKDIVGYENLYQISNTGFVKNNDGLILKGSSIRGYKTCLLCNNKKRKGFRTHRLVALHFIDNPLNKKEVNHIDGNKANNNVDNLEWSTRLENAQHAAREGLYESGGNRYNAKIVNQLDLDGNFIKAWECIKDASKELKLCDSSISYCCKGKRKTCGGFRWIYSEQK